MKRYYVNDKRGELVEVSRELARDLVRSGKRRPEDFQIDDAEDVPAPAAPPPIVTPFSGYASQVNQAAEQPQYIIPEGSDRRAVGVFPDRVSPDSMGAFAAPSSAPVSVAPTPAPALAPVPETTTAVSPVWADELGRRQAMSALTKTVGERAAQEERDLVAQHEADYQNYLSQYRDVWEQDKKNRSGRAILDYRLSSGVRPMMRDEFARARSGYTAPKTWMPDGLRSIARRERTIPQVAGEVTGTFSRVAGRPIAELLPGYDPEFSEQSVASRTRRGFETQARLDDFRGAEKAGSRLTEGELQFIEENDPGVIKGTVQAVKAIPEFVSGLFTNPEERRQFFESSAEEIIPSLAVSGGASLVLDGLKGLRGVAKVWGEGRSMKKRVKSGEVTPERAAEVSRRYWQSEGGRKAVEELYEAVKKRHPSVAYEMAKEVLGDGLADTFVETMNAYGRGESTGFVENFISGLPIDLAPYAVISAGRRGVDRVVNGPDDGLSRQQFESAMNSMVFSPFVRDNRLLPVAPGVVRDADGNVLRNEKGYAVNQKVGTTDIRPEIEDAMQRPDLKERMAQIARLADNPETRNTRYRLTDEDLQAELSGEELARAGYDGREGGTQPVRGFLQSVPGERSIATIGRQGNGSTVAHETIHDIESRLRREANEGEFSSRAGRLVDMMDDWMQRAQEWGRREGVAIPGDAELLTQAMTYRLGWDDDFDPVIRSIPVPDELVREFAARAGESLRGGQGLRKDGTKMDDMPVPSPDENGVSPFQPTVDANLDDDVPFSLGSADEAIRYSLRNMSDEVKRVKPATRVALSRAFEQAKAGKRTGGINFGRMNTALSQKLSDLLGRDLSGSFLSVSQESLFHANDRHGVGNEANPMQVPVTEETIQLIPVVVNDPTRVELSPRKDARGNQVVQIIRDFGDGTAVMVNGVVEGGKTPRLEMNTLYVWNESLARMKRNDAEVRGNDQMSGESPNSRADVQASGINVQDETTVPTASENIPNSDSDVNGLRFSLAAEAGIPDARKDDPKVVAAAEKAWREKGVESPWFRRWFGGSKVVDEQGRPLVVYHGTANDFSQFDDARTGANDGGLWGRGHYFTSSGKIASNYATRQGDGARLIPAYVSLKNPLTLNTGRDLITRLPDGSNFRDLLGNNLDGSKIKEMAISGGHDGVIQFKPDGSIGDLVAFSPSQIKSATGNRGTFDVGDPDIRFSLSRNDPRQKILTHVTKSMRTNGLRPMRQSDMSSEWRALTKKAKEDPDQRAKEELAWDRVEESLRQYVADNPTIAAEAGLKPPAEGVLDDFDVHDAIDRFRVWSEGRDRDLTSEEREHIERSIEAAVRGPGAAGYGDVEMANVPVSWLVRRKQSDGFFSALGENMRVKFNQKKNRFVVTHLGTKKSTEVPVGAKLWIDDPTMSSVPEFTGPDGPVSSDAGAPARQSNSYEGDLSSSEKEETRVDYFVRKIQDSFRDMRELQARAKNKEADPYREYDLMHGRSDYTATQMRRRFLSPILALMTKNDIPIDEVNKYLYAKHAKERNRYIASINEEFPDGGSGMKDAEADQILSEAKSNSVRHRYLEAISELNDKLSAWRNDILVKSGMLSEAEAKSMKDNWRHYVPLRGIVGDENVRANVFRGKVAKKDNKKAMGRSTQAEFVLAQNFALTLDAIANAERNKAARELLNFANANPDAKYWEIDPTHLKRAIVEEKKVARPGEEHLFGARTPDQMETERKVKNQVIQTNSSDPSIVPVYVDGQAHYIQFKTEEGKRIAAAVKGLNEEQANVLMRGLGKINRVVGSLITQYSPEFVLTNFSRDYLMAISASYAHDGAAIARKVLTNTPLAVAGIARAEGGG